MSVKTRLMMIIAESERLGDDCEDEKASLELVNADEEQEEIYRYRPGSDADQGMWDDFWNKQHDNRKRRHAALSRIISDTEGRER